ncbi:hypothetical protein F5Y10DRAFT_131679 [Nemania abortiva]|nr:hypothetical protein F5Y10DRAFT_131679 [Nemania abortiva]
MPSVPRTHQVVPGAHVNIVLKADQRTGHQVRGTVQNVLTRGDHHRGIKVRLMDGRIGRVQSMASGGESDSTMEPYSGSIPTENPNPNPSAPMASAPENENARGPRGRGHRPRDRDVRLEEPQDSPPEQIDLSAYIVPSRRKGKGKKGADTDRTREADDPEDGSNSNEYRATMDVASATATCPVCGAFEGDETAVAHHVADHFGS